MSRHGPPVELADMSFAYRLARNRGATMKEHAILSLKRNVAYEDHWALRDVSFAIDRGQLVGVIGANGAGKSTLLKVIARVLPPTSGRVVVRGLVAPVIELGSGLNPELTGYENIVLYGALLGHDPRDLRRLAPAIAEWAGVADYLDVPVRGYSSGMLARLAFSVATQAVPEIMLVDEVLAVGDEAFRARSVARLSSMIARGSAVVLVSHALDEIVDLADRVIWLDGGQIRMDGGAREVVSAYRDAVSQSAAAARVVRPAAASS